MMCIAFMAESVMILLRFGSVMESLLHTLFPTHKTYSSRKVMHAQTNDTLFYCLSFHFIVSSMFDTFTNEYGVLDFNRSQHGSGMSSKSQVGLGICTGFVE